MLKQNSIPTLSSELITERFDTYPEQVLECEWNPALDEVLRLRGIRLSADTAPRFYAEAPDSRPIE